MRVLCPACDAQYDVPDRLIGSGRRLRCARCDHDWMVRPTTPAPVAPEPDAAPGPALPAAEVAELAPQRLAPRPPAAGSRAPVGALGLWLAWLASVGAVLLAVVGLWLFRAELAVAWPPIQRLYGLLA
jgi:predicted Zn finger-like uncharacterized protein